MDMTEQLFKEHSDGICRYLCRMMNRTSDAEDVLSEVFVKLIREAQKGRDESFNWRAWLYRVATNCAVSHFRKQRVRRLFGLNESHHHEMETESAASEDFEINEDGKKVKDAVARLDPKYKSVIVMQVYDELSYKEIADILQINIGTVKSRLNEAKRILKEALEPAVSASSGKEAHNG